VQVEDIDGMQELRFENTVKISEAEYMAVWGVTRAPKKLKVAAFLVAGVVCLLTPYTLLLGIGLLVLAVLALFTPLIIPGGARDRFRKTAYLQDALTYGVSEHKLWVKGSTIDASVPWSMLYTWREIEDWLVLSPNGIPPIYLSLARLRNEGLYGRVRALAASNAPEFNTSRPRSN
jgi:hypothetical protein